MIKFPPFVIRPQTEEDVKILTQICQLLGCKTGFKSIRLGKLVRIGWAPGTNGRYDIGEGLSLAKYKDLGYAEVQSDDITDSYPETTTQTIKFSKERGFSWHTSNVQWWNS